MVATHNSLKGGKEGRKEGRKEKDSGGTIILHLVEVSSLVTRDFSLANISVEMGILIGQFSH